MAGFKDKLLNILLFPHSFFARLNDKRLTLCAGILLVGLIDLFAPDVTAEFKLLFTGMPMNSIRLNILIAVAVVVLLGVVDTLFFSLPLYDLFKYIKKKEDKPHNASPIKMIKIYVSAHFLIIPITIITYYAFFRGITENSSTFIINIYMLFFLLKSVWFSAIISRGANTLFSFNPLFMRLTFIIVFTWNFLLGMVFELQIMKWLFKLFIHP